MLTCRLMNLEAKRFMFKNFFRIEHMGFCHLDKGIAPGLIENIKKVEHNWKANGLSRSVFAYLAKYPALKVLSLRISSYSVREESNDLNPNRLYQDDKDAELGNKLFGFDNLVRLRGLEHVIVTVCKSHYSDEVYHHRDAEAVINFNTFLNRVVTQPKVVKIPVSLILS